MHRTIVMAWLLGMTASGAAGAAVGTTEVLFITDGDNTTLQAIQGNVITRTNASMPGTTLYAITARDTLWVADYRANTPGRVEFDKSTLAPTGATGAFTQVAGGPEVLDGATDGAFNYTIIDETGDVARYGLDWSGSPVTLFTAACDEFCPGITFDSADGTVWVANETSITEYAMNGTPGRTFLHGASAGGLAYESSTGTLWLVDNGTRHTLRQYSKAGTLLGTTVTATDYSVNVWGAEFTAGAAPAPTTTTVPVPLLTGWKAVVLAGLLLAGGTLALRRRRG